MYKPHFFLKIEANNQGCGLSTDTSVFGFLKILIILIFIKLLKMSRNKHERNLKRVAVVH